MWVILLCWFSSTRITCGVICTGAFRCSCIWKKIIHEKSNFGKYYNGIVIHFISSTFTLYIEVSIHKFLTISTTFCFLAFPILFTSGSGSYTWCRWRCFWMLINQYRIVVSDLKSHWNYYVLLSKLNPLNITFCHIGNLVSFSFTLPRKMKIQQD